MNDRLCFEVHDNKGYFVFPDTWFGPLLGEFEEVLDAYDADEISETSYINKLRRLAQREPDFIDIHAHDRRCVTALNPTTSEPPDYLQDCMPVFYQ